MEKNNKIEDIFQEFYFAVKIKNKNEYTVYTSETFKLSEIDIINLIKICILESRSKIIGRKLLAMYEDSTSERKHITEERLKKIGLIKENEADKTTTTRKNPRTK